MKKPVVSVIMPVFNTASFVGEALDSLFSQTLENFEIIIVDDCSTDDSVRVINEKIVKKIRKDVTIIFLRNEKNIGPGGCLNKAISLASGRYIARLDSDDIAKPERLEIQTNYLEGNKKVGIIGSQSILIDEQGEIVGSSAVPTDPFEISWKVNFKNPFISSTVIFRKSIVDQFGFHFEGFGTEDYFMWSKIVSVSEAINLPDELVYYRIRNNSLTFSRKEKMESDSIVIALSNLRNRYWIGRIVQGSSLENLIRTIKQDGFSSSFSDWLYLSIFIEHCFRYGNLRNSLSLIRKYSAMRYFII